MPPEMIDDVQSAQRGSCITCARKGPMTAGSAPMSTGRSAAVVGFELMAGSVSRFLTRLQFSDIFMWRMPPPAPIWRRAFDTVERGVGVPLEALVRTERFFDAVTVTTKARSALRGELERASRRALHLVNIPTATDV